jgi:cystathionine beta-lyase/cystathionine gamma-synthase
MMKKPYDWRTAKHNSIVPPIIYRGHETHLSVTYGAPNAQTLARRFSGEEPGFIYMGMGEGNPTVREFERMIVATETGRWEEYDAYACATGNIAIRMLTQYLLRKKKLANGARERQKWNVVSSAYVYGGTFGFFDASLPEMHMECRFVEHPEQREAWEAKINARTKFLFLETPANPHGTVFDIAMVAEVAHAHGLSLVIDNTVATGALQRPLDLGADMVVLSATKGINGHSTAGGGILVAKKEFIKEFRAVMQGPRPVMDPRAAVDMMIGLSDLNERMERHSANGLLLATMLKAHSGVGEVYYAFLPENPGYALAKKQMKGGGPLFSFTLVRYVGVVKAPGLFPTSTACPATIEESQRFINMLTENGLIPLAVHIAHDRTLATHPASTSHAKVPKPSREQIGITDNMIRVSVGSESPEDFAVIMEQFQATLETWAMTSV